MDGEGYYATSNQEEARIGILSSDRADFKLRNWSFMYLSNSIASSYMRQKLIELKGKRNVYIIIVGDFKTLLLVIERPSRKKISKGVVELNTTISQLDVWTSID